MARDLFETKMSAIRKFGRVVSPLAVTSSISLLALSVNNCCCDDSAENEKRSGEEYFHNLFPVRQLCVPKKAYPLWDEDWDGNQESRSKTSYKELRKEGVTRHVILIRHGQYDETSKEDEKRKLTELGRKQAELTGMRLNDILANADIRVRVMHVSNLTRAKETADIIAKHINVPRAEPDSDLNEGRPCHVIPTHKVELSSIEKVDEHHARIERAFQKYFYASPLPSQTKHELTIIVCHGNVIRYFFCRALQIPPEAWLRLCTFNCSLTYFTIRPTGTVSCRMLGDIGHLGYQNSTFSMHHGFNW